jgi:hypothetical protein
MTSTRIREPWIDTDKLKKDLGKFFEEKRPELYAFGRTVNQVFEAFVFASVATWYRERGWTIEFVHPRRHVSKHLRLKFNTRGKPSNYSFIRCSKEQREVHIRHQIRVATSHYRVGQRFRANVVLDVAILEPAELDWMETNDYIPNENLISFGEAKHMSAFAELVANFVGLIHELQPRRLKRHRFKTKKPLIPVHLSPFLFVSGFLFPTAQGLRETIIRRGYDIDIFWRTNQLCQDLLVSGKAIPKDHNIKKQAGPDND